MDMAAPANHMRFADVIIDISHEKTDRPFTYRIPESLTGTFKEGDAVRVPFGKGNKERSAYIIAFRSGVDYPEAQIKEILGPAKDPSDATAVTVRLAAWMKETYGSTMYRALRTVAPVRKQTAKPKRKFLSLKLPEREARDYYQMCVRRHYAARARLLEEMLKAPDTRFHYDLVTEKLNVSPAVLKGLADKGVIRIEEETYYRNPVTDLAGGKKQTTRREEHTLSDEQRAAVTGILSDFDKGNFRTYLLHGITGSGKTEVYIRLIEEIIRRGRQAIVLIPEIALTFQTLMRFYSHFDDRVSCMHSMLSDGERADQAERAKEGLIDVIIGPRSALFTPFANLGLIIIDEEHEGTYKSENMPKYHARDVAIKLAELSGNTSVVLGSATPSVDTYERAMRGEYGCFALTKRLTGGTLPRTEVIDLRQELTEGNRSIFSRRLQEELRRCVGHGEQAMLFLNRRGYAGFVSCRACGYVFKCPHCDVSLTAHGTGNYVCHYCGYTATLTRKCPSCGSDYVFAFRAGTEQIEREVKKILPESRVLRMDADTTKHKQDYRDILSAFSGGDADILVGTQMIVKGHDFPNVTLVGILAADLSLYAADYRAAERTFQLLTQAAGRAGRGEKEGSVILQTYQPEHYAVRAAAAQDYEAFFEEEMSYRTLLMYPPCAHLLNIQVFSRDAAEGERFATYMRKHVETPGDDLVLIGPAPGMIGKLNDLYRFALYVKHRDLARVTRVKDALEALYTKMSSDGTLDAARIQIQFDLDPMRGF